MIRRTFIEILSGFARPAPRMAAREFCTVVARPQHQRHVRILGTPLSVNSARKSLLA